jgi:hypothetical protein
MRFSQKEAAFRENDRLRSQRDALLDTIEQWKPVIEAAKALELADRAAGTTLFAFATMDSSGGKAVRDFIYSVRRLLAAEGE